MARYALIVGGLVANVIEADIATAAAAASDLGGTAVQSDVAGVGDAFGSGEFTAAAPITYVPPMVTKRQARQALILAGLFDDVQTAIDAIPDATSRALMQSEWDDSQVFERYRPSLLTMATAIGLDSDDLDALFITAAGL